MTPKDSGDQSPSGSFPRVDLSVVVGTEGHGFLVPVVHLSELVLHRTFYQSGPMRFPCIEKGVRWGVIYSCFGPVTSESGVPKGLSGIS